MPACALALSTLAMGAACPAQETLTPGSTDPSVAVTPGEVLLTGSFVATINDSSSPTAYRLCISQERGTVNMLVRVDGFDATVIGAHGCKVIVGRRIQITPETNLRGDERIVASYQQLPTYEASAGESSTR